MLHPVTGKDVRTEEVCEKNPPTYEHDMEVIISNWAEHWSRCKHCTYEFGAHL